MVILLEKLECINFEKNGEYLNEKIIQTTIKVAAKLCGNLIRIYFHVADMPFVHHAAVCLLKLNQRKQEMVVRIKPFFNKENARIMSCFAYPVSRSRFSNDEVITKLRARCLI